MLRRVMMALGGDPASGWVTTADLVLDQDSVGWDGYTLRQVIPASALTAGSKVRLRLEAASFVGLSVSAAYLGVLSGTYSYADTPAPVTVGGTSIFSIPAGSSVETDEIILSVPTGAGLVLGVNIISGGVARSLTLPGWMKYEKLGEDAGTVSASSYSGGTGSSYLVSRVDIFT